MLDFNVDKHKAKASLLYIALNIPNVDAHKLYKVLYFAEKDHLVNYGRPITGDSFIKMPYGPVPSYIKDKVEQKLDVDGSVKINGIQVLISEYPDMDELSESDIECLDKSIEENEHKTFNQLKNESHRQAWTDAVMSSRISSINIATEGNAQEGILEYIKHNLEDSSDFY